MKRDYIQFPDDENGDVLWRIHCNGDDLSKPREIDFSVVFPTEEAALEFAIRALRSGFKVDLNQFEKQQDGLIWDLSVYTRMIPTHADITAFEKALIAEAARLGGRNDGWGFFQQ